MDRSIEAKLQEVGYDEDGDMVVIVPEVIVHLIAADMHCCFKFLMIHMWRVFCFRFWRL